MKKEELKELLGLLRKYKTLLKNKARVDNHTMWHLNEVDDEIAYDIRHYAFQEDVFGE